MNTIELNRLKHFFVTYADDYIRRSDDPAPLSLKKDHTLRVCREILSLGTDLHLSVQELRLAEAMALLHDLGRFPQYETYRTFLDHRSENHARLGLKEIAARQLLTNLSPEERRLIKAAVGFHNAARVPEQAGGEMGYFIRLLRDADKLDIWRVVIGNYTDPRPESREVINLGLPDDDGVSGPVLEALCRETFVKSGDIRRLNDFKLMQISWVFDLNFIPSIARAHQRGCVDAIAAALPDLPAVRSAVDHVKAYMGRVLQDTALPGDGAMGSRHCMGGLNTQEGGR